MNQDLHDIELLPAGMRLQALIQWLRSQRCDSLASTIEAEATAESERVKALEKELEAAEEERDDKARDLERAEEAQDAVLTVAAAALGGREPTFEELDDACEVARDGYHEAESRFILAVVRAARTPVERRCAMRTAKRCGTSRRGLTEAEYAEIQAAAQYGEGAVEQGGVARA